MSCSVDPECTIHNSSMPWAGIHHEQMKKGEKRISKQAVWKFRIPMEVKFELAMPIGAEILTVDTQYYGRPGEEAVMWALVDPGIRVETRRFQMVGTGARELDGLTEYVGTCQLTGGSLVLHIFEVK